MSLKLATVVFLICATAYTDLPASARAKEHLRYKEEKPAIDSSVLPKTPLFRLDVKHTAIIFPEPNSTLLHGDAHVFRLRADENVTKLQAEQPEATSPMNTRQHGITAQFHSDLLALIPKIAPDLSRRLDAELGKAQRQLAARAAKDAPALKRALQAEKPAPSMPAPSLPAHLQMPEPPQAKPIVPAMDTLAPNGLPNNQPKLDGNIDAAQARAAQTQRAAIAAARGHMQAQLGGGGGGGAGGSLQMPMGGRAVPPFMPQLYPRVSAMPTAPQASSAMKALPQVRTQVAAIPSFQPDSNLNGQLIAAKQAMQAQLKATNRRPDESRDVDAQLRRAQNIATEVKPQLDALMTNARRLPPLEDPVIPQMAIPDAAAGRDTIIWDKWHANFANLARGPLLTELNKAGSPEGSDTVAITVYSDHHVDVKLYTSSNPKFDKAVMQAYQSLNKSPRLDFPAGSLRRSVSFLIDNKHSSHTSISIVNSKTTKGDKETRRFGH